jgi:hypothetical protein
MKRSTKIVTSMLGLAVVFEVQAARGGPINPNDFTSLGTLNITGGSYAISGDTITGPNGFSLTGASYDGIGVLDFSGITISGGDIG